MVLPTDASSVDALPPLRADPERAHHRHSEPNNHFRALSPNSPTRNRRRSQVQYRAGDDTGSVAHIENAATTANTTDAILVETASHAETVPATLPLHDQNFLVLLQAKPLVFQKDGKYHPLDLLDDENERAVLSSIVGEASGGTVQVQADILTADRLSAAMAQAKGWVLHLSCHGNNSYLAFDDGWGEMQMLTPSDLKEWFSKGGSSKLVFACACDSVSAGLAFVEAGVPHVVCCRHIQDKAGIHFSKSFYRYLTSGSTIQASFDLAKEEIRNCPHIDAPFRLGEAEKFLLLPADANHDVVLYPRQNTCTGIPDQQSTPVVSSVVSRVNTPRPMFPPASDFFTGRQVLLFEVLNALKYQRYVTLSGPAGSGKHAVSRAACEYLHERRAENLLSEIVWCTYGVEQQWHVDPSFKTFFAGIQGAFALVNSKDIAVEKLNDKLRKKKAFRKLIRFVRERKTLVVLDAPEVNDEATAKKLELFIETLINQSKKLKILLIPPSSIAIEPSKAMIGGEEEIPVSALDWESTLDVFQRVLSLRARNSLCRHGIASEKELCDLLNKAAEGDEDLNSKHVRDIWKMIGAGLPKKIFEAAKGMTEERLAELVAIAREGVNDLLMQRMRFM